MISVNITDSSATYTDCWQYDHGQTLSITGLSGLAQNTEVHFAAKDAKAAEVRIGTYADGVLTVSIPDKLFFTGREFTAYIYPSDETCGETMYTVLLKPHPRPKPEDIEGPDANSGWSELTAQLNGLIDHVSSVNNDAAVSAYSAAASAIAAEASAIGYSPHIEDGTWRQYETGGFVNTGVNAQGPAATLAVGTVTTGAAGSSASVSNAGTGSAAVFNFTIPKGDKGDTGSAATIAVGTVTTGAAGSSVSVANSGTSGAARFDFAIPRGSTGAAGAKWYSAAGVPSESVGVSGDYDLNTANGDIYAKGSTWVLAGNIKGATGQTGQTGATGASLEYNWSGTSLGVRQAGGSSYTYVDLKGATGATGAPGTNGTGVPTGGTTGQALVKSSGTDYAVGWQTMNGAGVPMTSYTKPASTSAVAATDTVNAAVGKVEKALDGLVPTSRTVNGKALSANLTLDGTDLKILPLITHSKSGTVHTLTTSLTGQFTAKFNATAAFAEGDSWQIGTTAYTAKTQGGTSIPGGFFASDAKGIQVEVDTVNHTLSFNGGGSSGIWIGSTAPNTSIYKVWLDTTINVIKYWNGTAWISTNAVWA